MAVPLAAVAARVVRKYATTKAKQHFPGGVWGAIVGVVAIVVFFVLVMALSLVNLFQMGTEAAAAAANACDQSGSAYNGAMPSSIPGISAVALDAYYKAAQQSGINWTYIAGIGKIESGHGTTGGRHLDSNGNVEPTPIYGPVTAYGRAEGPMQFLSTTWAGDGRDGNGDGKKDAQNIYDAALTTGYYLRNAGGPGDMYKAIYAYNHADWYVQEVMAAAKQYAAEAANAPAGGNSTGPSLSNLDGMIPASNTAPSGGGNTSTTDGSTWVMPEKPGTYRLGLGFGVRGSEWSLGYHTGQDFLGSLGTPVYAASGGIVMLIPGQTWAGPNFVAIDHGIVDGKHVYTWYAHMEKRLVSNGEHVTAGQQIGLEGYLGNVIPPTPAGAHLHFEVHLGSNAATTAVNPITWLSQQHAGSPSGGVVGLPGDSNCGPSGGAQPDGPGPWGGYTNGNIPLKAMCQLNFTPGYLECHAADALDAMNKVYRQRFGHPLGPVIAYQSYAEQTQCRPAKATDPCPAVPGTSPHGWGMAVDLSGGINRFGTPQYRWMAANAGHYGWVQPAIDQQHGSTPAPWHWEFHASQWQTSGTDPSVGQVGGAPAGHSTARFKIGDWNMPGASGQRMVREVANIRARGISVLTMQAFGAPQQQKFKGLTGRAWSMWGDRDNYVAWKTADWQLEATSTFTIPDSGGTQRLMPTVRLKNVHTGTEIIVVSVHNPAGRYGARAIAIEGPLMRSLAANGTPVYFNGDMNETTKFFCPFMAYGGFHAAAGGSYPGTCRPPHRMPVDWITGSTDNTTFSGYTDSNQTGPSAGTVATN